MLTVYILYSILSSVMHENALKKWIDMYPKDHQGIYRAWLANQCGVSDHTVWSWIIGRRTPGIKVVGKVAQATGLSVYDIRPDLRRAIEGDG